LFSVRPSVDQWYDFRIFLPRGILFNCTNVNSYSNPILRRIQHARTIY